MIDYSNIEPGRNGCGGQYYPTAERKYPHRAPYEPIFQRQSKIRNIVQPQKLLIANLQLKNRDERKMISDGIMEI